MYVCTVPPTVTPLDREPIGVETRDGTPSQITVGFSITRAFPSVQLDDITWNYTPTRGSTETSDVAALANNSSKYVLSDDLRTLTIFNLNFSDAGYFTLSAINEAGMRNATLELIIHGKKISTMQTALTFPVSIVEPELLNASYSGNETVENQTASFTCVADGYPQPNIIWLHNDSFILENIMPRHEVSLSPVSSTNRAHIPKAISSTLTVSRLRLRDSGEYLCRVDPSNLDRGRSTFSETFDMTVFPGIMQVALLYQV